MHLYSPFAMNSLQVGKLAFEFVFGDHGGARDGLCEGCFEHFLHIDQVVEEGGGEVPEDGPEEVLRGDVQS